MSNVNNEIVELMVRAEAKKNLKGETMFPKDPTKKVKEKKKSRYAKDAFEPIQNGFVTATSTDIPYGYNWALGYCQETVEESVRKKNKDMS